MVYEQSTDFQNKKKRFKIEFLFCDFKLNLRDFEFSDLLIQFQTIFSKRIAKAMKNAHQPMTTFGPEDHNHVEMAGPPQKQNNNTRQS